MDETVHILWTGGWDSTYRILEILLRSDWKIQPHYIVDPERMSAPREMEAMEQIRRSIAERNPDWAGRIMETRITDLEDIPQDPTIEAAFKEVRGREYIGSQCCWLARYVKMLGLQGIEICNESSDTWGGRIAAISSRVPGVEPQQYELSPELSEAGSEMQVLFKWFRFPLVHYGKRDMERAIDHMDAWAVMAKTWFCHRPVRSRYPCGTCRPCVYVMEKGQGWRLGPIGRVDRERR